MNQIPYISNAYENVKGACEERLAQLYPAGIPSVANERLTTELTYLQNQPVTQCKLEIFRLLFKEACRSMQFLTIEGTDASSFIVYLLGGAMANPLPPHYYCPKCGCYEEVPTKLSGIDLPQKECSSCHSVLYADGFNLPVSTCFWLDGAKILNLIGITTEDFLIFARRLLERIFPENQIVPMGTMMLPQFKNSVTVYPSGFYVLENGMTMEDYPHLHSYLEDGTPCICEDWDRDELFRVDLIPQENIERLVQLQTKNGLYLQNITLNDLKDLTWTDLKNTGVLSEAVTDILYDNRPKTFREFTNIIAYTQNGCASPKTLLQEVGYDDYTGGYRSIKECIHSPFTREDWREAIGHYEEDPKICFSISEGIRKGYYYRYQVTGKRQPYHYSTFERLPAPLQELANCQKFVCARSTAVSESLIYMMLAYYLKTNSKVYSKLVFRQRKEPK